jgi:ATP-dependent Clp protease ATP-binding subunit ClpC
VFERFTDRARHVVVYAQEEARMLNHDYIGTEHILLGLIHEGEGVAARALEEMGISLDAARARVEELIGQGPEPPTGHIPFTPRGKKVLELSLREALQMGHTYIGTEHILLGLVREGEGVGAQVLRELGADVDRVRQIVIQLLEGYAGSAEAAVGTGSVGTMAEIPFDVVPEGVLTKGPRCGRCHARLAETLTVSSLTTTAGHETLELKVAHCGRCGSAIGLVP